MSLIQLGVTHWPVSILVIQFHAPQTRPTRPLRVLYFDTVTMGKRKADNFIASDDDEEDQDFDKSESEQFPSSEEEKKPKSRKVSAKNDNSDDEVKPSSKKKLSKDKLKTVKVRPSSLLPVPLTAHTHASKETQDHTGELKRK